jgi:hypothetical protein
MAFSVNRSEIGSNRRTVTLMAIASLVKAETYASARCRVSVSCRLLRHHRWDSRAIAGLGGYSWHSLRSLAEIIYLSSDLVAFDAIFRECMRVRVSIQEVIGEEHEGVFSG